MSRFYAAHGGAPRNATTAEDVQRTPEGARPRARALRTLPKTPDDLEQQRAIREGRVIRLAPEDCRYHWGPATKPCQRCGAPWSWYAAGRLA